MKEVPVASQQLSGCIDHNVYHSKSIGRPKVPPMKRRGKLRLK